MFPMRRAKRMRPRMARDMENITSPAYVLVSSPCPSVLQKGSHNVDTQ